MSIRPIDYTSSISKSQEITKLEQVENNKLQMQIKEGFVEEEKKIKKDIKKVRDTNRNESSIIDTNKKNKKDKNKDKNKDKKRKKKKRKVDIGGRIDIKI